MYDYTPYYVPTALRSKLVVWSIAVLTYTFVFVFLLLLLSSVRLYAMLSPHCRRRFCGPVRVASMSGDRVSGAHVNMS